MSNPFSKFVTKTQKVKIKSLDNAEVEVREPTVAEIASFYKFLTNEKGELDSSKFADAKILRVSTCMVNPSMTIEELNALSSSSQLALNEVYEAIEGLTPKDGIESGN